MRLNRDCIRAILAHTDEKLANKFKRVTLPDLHLSLNHHSKDDILDAVHHLAKTGCIEGLLHNNFCEITDITHKGYQYLNLVRNIFRDNGIRPSFSWALIAE